jgi:hypothetical protein
MPKPKLYELEVKLGLRKGFSVILFTLVAVSFVAAQAPPQHGHENRAAKEDSAPAASEKATSEKPNVNVQAPTSSSEKDPAAEAESLDIQRKLEWFTGVLALVGVCQFCAMFWQGWVLKGTLEAVKQQAEIARTTLVSSFRPKIEVRRIRLNPCNYAKFLAKNEPVWRVELILANKGATQATIEKCGLSIAMCGDDPLPWQPESIPIAFKEWTAITVPPAGRIPLEFEIRESGFWISFGTQVEMLNRSNNHGQAIWPTCYGTIVYVDENGHRRQTGFSRRWNIPGERFEVSDDPELEYQD